VDRDGTPEKLRHLLRTRTGCDFRSAKSFPVYLRTRTAMVDRFRVDRVFLAGDAAPSTRRRRTGLNTSVQDAYNLGGNSGQCLSTAPRDAARDLHAERHRVCCRAPAALQRHPGADRTTQGRFHQTGSDTTSSTWPTATVP